MEFGLGSVVLNVPLHNPAWFQSCQIRSSLNSIVSLCGRVELMILESDPCSDFTFSFWSLSFL